MSKINEIALSTFVKVQNASVTRREEGQGTLEYIAMAAGFVILAYGAWKLFGGQVKTYIEGLFGKVTS